MSADIDLLVVGGGINGTAIARDAALNGLRVMLVEKDDLASHTSSASTKLIHGGLRYLEYYEFKLVREALQERERLIYTAPHIIHEMRFVLPHQNAVRPWWLVRIGLLIYDLLGGRNTLAKSRGLKAADSVYRAPLKNAAKGFVYSDAWVDDARLVVLNAVDAAKHGAQIKTRVGLASARREGGLWRADLTDGSSVTAKAMINAAGPWVAELLAKAGVNAQSNVRLIKGSHIVVDQLFEGDHAYMLQQPDRRIVFAIAYQGNKTLIGTTDEPVERPEDAKISAGEIQYLCDAANRYFSRQIAPADVAATYSGVRPLYDDGASEAKAVTRDYVLELDENGPPVLSVFGGKITTARHLAQEAVARLSAVTGWANRDVTDTATLPGGDLPRGLSAYIDDVQRRWPFLGAARADRMARAYGTLLNQVLDGVSHEADLGQDFGDGLTAREVDWLIEHEWAKSADDILLRRTKIGLATGPETKAAVEAYLVSRQDAASSALARDKGKA